MLFRNLKSLLRFAGIGTAFAVLSDPEKKARYDEYGETLEPARIGRRQYNEFEREFEGWSYQ